MNTLSFEQVYINNRGWVKNYVNQRLNCGFETAEDLTQDIFIKVCKHLPNFDENKSTLNTFINTIVRTKVIDYHRHNELKRKKFTKNIEGYVNENDEQDFDAPSIYDNETDANLLEEEMSLLIQNTLNSFNDITQKVCKLYREGFKVSEISLECNVPEGTVKVYQKRFRDKLYSKIEKVY